MTAFGEYIPDPERIDAGDVTLGGLPVTSPAWIDDWFAPAQFDLLDDTTRLSSPSYELMTAGVEFGDSGVAVSVNETESTTVSRVYEESILPDETGKLSTYASPARASRSRPCTRNVAGESLELLPTTYTVVRRVDGQTAGSALAEAGLLGVGATYAEATAVMRRGPRPAPWNARRLQVSPLPTPWSRWHAA